MSIFALIFFITFYTIFPASWVDPINILFKIYHNGVSDRGFSDAPHASILNVRFLYYYEIFFTKTLGLNIIMLIYGLYYFYKNVNKNTKYNYLFLYSLVFFIYYFLIMSFPTKQLTRYTAIAYPFIFIFIANGYYSLFSKTNLYKRVLLVFIVIYYSITFYSIYPNFSTFHSEFLGGYKNYFNYKRIINDGEHYLQAGDYLNNKYKKQAYNLALVTTEGNKDVSVKYAFLGETFTGKIPNNSKNYTNIYILSAFDDVEDKPNCPLERGFGHRWPDILLT